jgi:mono/diheme cytochrome c family protein
MPRQSFVSFSALGLIAGLTLVAAGPVLAAGDAAAGKSAWTQEHTPPGADGPRSCATCHQADLTKAGKQVNTGKPIEPMAVSVNPQRLTDPAKVEKWLGRNCRWTLGRNCTDGEKADFLAYIRSQ